MASQDEKVATLTQELQKLDTERKAMESEIIDLCDLLNQPGMPGLKEKLTDSEGFPRADIDLYQVQSMRGRVATLNTDLSAAMKLIETKLAELHALSKEEAEQEALAAKSEKQGRNQDVKDTVIVGTEELKSEECKANQAPAEPCLWITDVVEGSPAADAGLLLGDVMLKFGDFVPTKAMPIEEIRTQMKQVCTTTVEGGDKVTIFVTVKRKSMFGDESEVVIMLYAKACVDESTGEVSLGCEVKKEPIF